MASRKEDWKDVIWRQLDSYPGNIDAKVEALFFFTKGMTPIKQAGIDSPEKLEQYIKDEMEGVSVENGSLRVNLPPNSLWHATDTPNLPSILTYGLEPSTGDKDNDYIRSQIEPGKEYEFAPPTVFMALHPTYAAYWKGISDYPLSLLEVKPSNRTHPVDNHGFTLKDRKLIRQKLGSGTLQMGSYDLIDPDDIKNVYVDARSQIDLLTINDPRIILVDSAMSAGLWNRVVAENYAKIK